MPTKFHGNVSDYSFLTKLVKLKSLRLRSPVDMPSLVHSLTQCKQLTFLQLDTSFDLNDYSFIMSMPELHFFQIAHCNISTSINLDKFVHSVVGGGLTKLVHLELNRLPLLSCYQVSCIVYSPGEDLLRVLMDELAACRFWPRISGSSPTTSSRCARVSACPGCAVLQFTFGGDGDDPIASHARHDNVIVYSRTHESTRRWAVFDLDQQPRRRVDSMLRGLGSMPEGPSCVEPWAPVASSPSFRRRTFSASAPRRGSTLPVPSTAIGGVDRAHGRADGSLRPPFRATQRHLQTALMLR